MARHEDARCLIAQRISIERGAGLGIARVEQQSNHRGITALFALPDDVIENLVNSAGGAADARRIVTRQPLRQSAHRYDIKLRNEALIFTERSNDRSRMLASQARPKNGAADYL